MVHVYRNIFGLVPSGKGRDVTRMLKAIHAQQDRKAAAEQIQAVIANECAMKLTKAAERLEKSGQEALTYDGFPDRQAVVRHWSEDNGEWIKLRTNNPPERIMRDIRRRTRMVGAFPDRKSCLNLVAARLRHIARTQWSTRKPMTMTPILRIKPKEPSSPENRNEKEL